MKLIIVELQYIYVKTLEKYFVVKTGVMPKTNETWCNIFILTLTVSNTED